MEGPSRPLREEQQAGKGCKTLQSTWGGMGHGTTMEHDTVASKMMAGTMPYTVSHKVVAMFESEKISNQYNR